MLAGLKTFWKSHRTELILFLIALPYLIAQNTHGGDFRVLLTGAGYLARGTSPYGVTMPIEPGITDVFLYSPFVGFVLMPLTYLPEVIPTFIFSLINFFILFRIWYIMAAWLQIGNFPPVKRRWWCIITIAFIIRFIMHVFENSQQNIIVLYLSLEGLYLIFLRGRAAGGLLLALGICLKLLPIVFLPYLVYKRKFSATLTAVSLFILLLLLPATWFGLTFDLHLLQGWWTAINPTLDKYNTQQNVGVQFHCISALIPVYFSDSNYHGFTVNIMNLPPDKLFLLINVVRLLLISFTLCFLWIGRSAKEQSALFVFWQLSYIFLLIPLIFPHQAKYSYVNLLPAFGYLAFYLVSVYGLTSPVAKSDKTILLVSMAAVFILTTLTADIIWGMDIGKYFQFLKLVTIGSLLLIPVLFFFSPKRLSGIL
jgi:hypothetical protein